MHQKNWFKKLSGLVGGITGISFLVSLPVLAQYYYPPSSFFQPTANYYESDEPCLVDINESKNIPDNLQVGCFQTLVAYLKQSGLLETLKHETTFTLFAPRDEAFKALPEEIRKKLSRAENLEKVLKYHLVTGALAEDDIKRGEIATVEGNFVQITGVPLGDRKVGAKLNDAMAGDPIKASNGYIVPIDKVLLPPDL